MINSNSPAPHNTATSLPGSSRGGGVGLQFTPAPYDGSPRAAFEQMVRLTVAEGAASPRTIKAYSASIGLFFAWAKSHDFEAHKATVLHVQAYRAELAKKYKRGTVKLYLRAVRLFFEALQRYQKREDNPAAGIYAPRENTPAEQTILDKALTPTEAMRLMDFLPHSGTAAGSRDRAVVLIMMLQGLRAAEVAGLTIRDLDDSYTRLTFIGKGSKKRSVTLAPEVRQALISWTETRFKRQAACFGGPLFLCLEPGPGYPRDDKHISVRMVERIADKYLNFAGLKKPGRSAHALRHTYAMLAVLGGAEREALGVSMGHAGPATTHIYTRAAAIFQDNPADAVSKMLRNGGSTK